MQLEQRQTLSQKLVLTQTMRQSLDCLQLSAPELAEYVQEVALSNPLLDVQSPTYYETELPSEAAPAEREPLEVRETGSWRGVTSSGMEDVQDFTAFLTREKTFRDHLTEVIDLEKEIAHLTEQIGQMKLVDDELLRLCRFLIDCLDERGYLDCPLEELSREFDIPLFSLEQALFAVQMLDPPGVGARNLSECLTLQLAQDRSLDPLALKIARDGLEMLGKRETADELLISALAAAEPDALYLPFVENYRYLKTALTRGAGAKFAAFVRTVTPLGEDFVRRCGEKRAEGSRPAALAGLTERESAIAALVAKRLSNREIAEQLFLSEGSVKQYINQIYSKLLITGDVRTKRKRLAELAAPKS